VRLRKRDRLFVEAFWDEGKLVFRRSQPMDRAIRMSVFKDRVPVWSVNNRHYPFKSVVCGTVPDVELDHRGKPEQNMPPDGGKPIELAPGDVVRFVLSFRQDSLFPLGAGHGAESWQITVPPRDEISRGVRVDNW